MSLNQPNFYLVEMRRNAEPAEKVLVLGLHPRHDDLHGQNSLCGVCEEGRHEVAGVLVIVPAQLDVAEGGLALLLHVGQVGPESVHVYPGDHHEVTEL